MVGKLPPGPAEQPVVTQSKWSGSGKDISTQLASVCVRLAQDGLQATSSWWPVFEWPIAKNSFTGAVKNKEDDRVREEATRSEAFCAAEPKIFTIWPLQRKAARPCSREGRKCQGTPGF